MADATHSAAGTTVAESAARRTYTAGDVLIDAFSGLLAVVLDASIELHDQPCVRVSYTRPPHASLAAFAPGYYESVVANELQEVTYPVDRVVKARLRILQRNEHQHHHLQASAIAKDRPDEPPAP